MVDRPESAPFFVLVDANIIVAEQVFLSAVGDAFIYLLVGSGGKICLPEVVRMEVEHVVGDLASEAMRRIGRDTAFLRNISGHTNFFLSPTEIAVQDGLRSRWQNLRGVVHDRAFDEAQAREALARVISKTPPAGKNNEQYRDCCIWVCAKELAKNVDTYLISRDHAFYQGGKIPGALAESLQDEVRDLPFRIDIFDSLQSFMNLKQTDHPSFNITLAKSLVTEAAMPYAHEYAKRSEIGVDKFLGAEIEGYALPVAGKIALSFSLKFSFSSIAGRERIRGKFEAGGNCTLDLGSMLISEVSVNQWSQSASDVDGQSFGRSEMSFPTSYDPAHVRLLK